MELQALPVSLLSAHALAQILGNVIEIRDKAPI